jgi:hypothetical protein
MLAYLRYNTFFFSRIPAGLLVDRRSVSWMLAYLRYAILFFPPSVRLNTWTKNRGTHATPFFFWLHLSARVTPTRVRRATTNRHTSKKKKDSYVTQLFWFFFLVTLLSASCDQNPYPPRSNIYGTAWKVAQSVSFVAHCSSQNRVLLHQARRLFLFFYALFFIYARFFNFPQYFYESFDYVLCVFWLFVFFLFVCFFCAPPG